MKAFFCIDLLTCSVSLKTQIKKVVVSFWLFAYYWFNLDSWNIINWYRDIIYTSRFYVCELYRFSGSNKRR